MAPRGAGSEPVTASSVEAGSLWPARPRPEPDELLSSWLVRLADANGLKLHSFCAATWPAVAVWNRDVDKSTGGDLLPALARRTGVPAHRVRETLLSAYAGRLYETHNPAGNTRWILPAGVYHRTRRRFGQQFCPACLDGDRQPYFRRAWRLACSVVCPEHRTPLRDRCVWCEAPIAFFRGELGNRARARPAAPITNCTACAGDLRSASGPALPTADRIEIEAERTRASVLARGWTTLRRTGPVYGHLYFDGIRQLCRILSSGRAAAPLRYAVCRRYGVDPHQLARPTDGARELERFGTGARRHLLLLAHVLLSDWPEGLLDVCERTATWSSAVLRDCDPTPYWLWRPVRDHLYRPDRSASGRPKPRRVRRVGHG